MMWRVLVKEKRFAEEHDAAAVPAVSTVSREDLPVAGWMSVGIPRPGACTQHCLFLAQLTHQTEVLVPAYSRTFEVTSGMTRVVSAEDGASSRCGYPVH